MEPRTLKVVLPLPDKKLSPNNKRGHWAPIAAAAKKARADAHAATYYAISATNVHVAAFALHGPIELQTTFFKRTRHVQDADNALAQMKHHFDGIADQLGTNDSRFRHLPVKFELDRLNPRVEIVLTEVIEQLRNPCPNCTGKPWSWKDGVEWHTGEVCPVCNGSQKVPVTQPELTDAFRAAVADEAEMLAFIQLLKESLKADIRREMDAAIAEDAEFDCAVNVPRDQLRALQLLLSRYQSQQERIKELEEACADLDEARIALFAELASLKASQEPPQNDFDYNSPPFQSAGKRMVQHKPEETQS